MIPVDMLEKIIVDKIVDRMPVDNTLNYKAYFWRPVSCIDIWFQTWNMYNQA